VQEVNSGPVESGFPLRLTWSGRTALSDGNHRAPKPSSRWTRGPLCTNFYLGPLSGGWSGKWHIYER